jgi:putative transferase (TIGR04331 family)
MEETWPTDESPILFLGEWCRLYNKKALWGRKNAEVAPYHWDDREKLHKDYLYLQALYEELLVELAAKLNAVHGVNHSVRYWRIIVGPWLGYFIQMLFDRWAMLRQVIQNSDISGVRVMQRGFNYAVSNDMEDFNSKYLGDPWNETIFGQLLEWMDIPVETVHETVESHATASKPFKLISKWHLKQRLDQIAGYVSGLIHSDTEYFFINSYLPLKQDFLLQLKLGQLPKRWRTVPVPVTPENSLDRQWEVLPPINSNDFPGILRAMIPRHIPTAYLEGYGALLRVAQDLPWPKKPKAIFTSSAYSADDVFKSWAADKVEGGVPLAIGQHGGNYGMARWGFEEEHQIAIADHFLTWGWREEESDKVTPVGNLKGFGKKMIPDRQGGALMIEMMLPRMSYHMYSVPVARQWLDYFKDQCRFVQALPQVLRNQLLVRLFPHEFGWCQSQRWEDRYPTLALENGIQPMALLMAKSRICISTYNATTYLESMSLNFPTIMFWSPNHWELRDSALTYFEKLKSVGIFHETPESAARQMAQVWDDVSGWWQGSAVQSVRKEFCDRYAHTPKDPLESMNKLFRCIADGSGNAQNPR